MHSTFLTLIRLASDWDIQSLLMEGISDAEFPAKREHLIGMERYENRGWKGIASGGGQSLARC
jgi:hypothetical protein